MKGFHRLEDHGVVVVAAQSFRDEIESLGLTDAGGLDRWRASGAPVAGGRSDSVRVRLPRSGTPVHLRPLAHGGWLRGLTGRRFLGLARPEAELATAATLVGRGVAVPEPLLFVARRSGPFREIDVGSRFVEESVSLDPWLADGPAAAAPLPGGSSGSSGCVIARPSRNCSSPMVLV